MSTLNPAATATRRAAVSVPATPSLETVTIRWSLSRQALRTAQGLRPVGMTIAEQGQDLELTWVVDVEAGQGAAQLCDPATGTSAQIALTPVRCTTEGDLLHFEAHNAADPLLIATVRAGETDIRVLYARTSLLAALGLGGGRYEVL